MAAQHVPLQADDAVREDELLPPLPAGGKSVVPLTAGQSSVPGMWNSRRVEFENAEKKKEAGRRRRAEAEEVRLQAERLAAERVVAVGSVVAEVVVIEGVMGVVRAEQIGTPEHALGRDG